MPMFGFDEQYAYYGVTPVDNQFILEYLPNATGDAVRVYLYGLMQCYHPQQAMTLEQMARELSMEEDAVLAHYRYWERRGLVHRVTDHPPTFRYVSLKQLTLAGGAAPIDQDYELFAATVYTIFSGRRIHGAEMSRCYEWVEEMGLPEEVVLYLIRVMVEHRGKKVTIPTIEKRAVLLAEEGVRTVEMAEAVLNRDIAVWDGSREVLQRLGRSRTPSEDEEKLYRKWHLEWGFARQDILDACAATVSGSPNFKYLDGIIRRLHEEQKTSDIAAVMQQEVEESAPLKKLLKVMNDRDTTVNATTLQEYAGMRALYPDNIILMAGAECAKRGARFKDVAQTLKIWKRNDLQTAEDVTRYMKEIDAKNDLLCVIYEALGVKAKPNAADRKRLQKWTEQFGYAMEFILQCTAGAIDAGKPMAYLDALLENLHKKNIRTSAEAAREGETFKKSYVGKRTKAVVQQQYTQREYVHTEDAMDAMMKDWEEHADA